MTTIIERTAQALYAHRLTTGDFPDGETAWEDLPEPWKDEWREAAEFLADAGVLAPDLPEPDDTGTTDDGAPAAYWDVHDPVDRHDVPPSIGVEGPDIVMDIPVNTSPAHARRYAYALRAAADYAEAKRAGQEVTDE